MSNLELSL